MECGAQNAKQTGTPLEPVLYVQTLFDKGVRVQVVWRGCKT